MADSLIEQLRHIESRLTRGRWKLWGSQVRAPKPGYCHRYPPTVNASDEGSLTEFPFIDDSDWCGEWAHRKEKSPLDLQLEQLGVDT